MFNTEEGGSNSFCLGMIGASKFCIKICEENQTGCGVAAHAKKFSPLGNTFYMKENETRAFIKPAFEAPELTREAHDELLAKRYTLKELETLFEDLSEGRMPGWVKEVTLPMGEDQSLTIDVSASFEDIVSVELVSPKYSTENLGIFVKPPTLSFESEDEDIENDPYFSNLSDANGALKGVLTKMRANFMRLRDKWTQTFLEVEESHVNLVKDLQSIKKTSTALRKIMGKPDNKLAWERKTLWEGIETTAVRFDEKTRAISADCIKVGKNVESITSEQHEMKQLILEAMAERSSTEVDLKQSLALANLQIQALEDKTAEYDKRFNIIYPLLLDMRAKLANQNISSNASTHPQVELRNLYDKIEALENKVDLAVAFPTNTTITGFAEQIEDLQQQLHLVNQRITGRGVQISSKVFQSFDDVVIWVKVNLPNHRYGLFVDAISLLDFFSFLGHIDNENQLAAFHNQQKAGFATQYESRVVTSIQNLFPHVFGKAGSEESQYLPSISDPDKWDNGMHGLRHSINKGMNLVETQLENAINTILRPYPEARQIAQECLYRSKRFVTELCAFISDDYNKWYARGHGKKDAWRMTSVCVRRVFEEIHAERVVARDSYDHKDTAFTAAKILWATWKAHCIMERYMKHQFYEHPSVAAVLARHLADNYTKPDDSLGSKITNLEKQYKTLTGQIDRLNNLEHERNGGRPKGDTPTTTPPGKRHQPKIKTDKTDKTDKAE